jgi:hypothetical protein
MATMNEELYGYQGKSVGDLGREALWFLLHTLIGIAVVGVILLGGILLHADPDSASPKMMATLLSFALGLAAGFAIARSRRDYVARHMWISALVLFAVVCVWVVDLPTGRGLCEHCGALDKLTRTFFSIDDGSGLAGGWGLVLGCWIPLALCGYAVGGRLAVGSTHRAMAD